MIWNLLLACGVEEKEVTPNEGEVIVEAERPHKISRNTNWHWCP